MRIIVSEEDKVLSFSDRFAFFTISFSDNYSMQHSDVKITKSLFYSLILI